MKVILISIASVLFCYWLNAQSIQENFADGELLQNPAWLGNTQVWQIVNNSDAGPGDQASQTLRLSVPSGSGLFYLATAVNDWGINQHWSFWMGRRSQALTSSNTFYFWLIASDSNFNSPNLSGYRLAIGDDQGEDEIRLEYLKEGQVDSVFLISSHGIPNGRTDFGIQFHIARSFTGHWSLYSSAFPSANGDGTTASQLVDSTFCKNWLASAHHQDDSLFQSGYLGFGGQITSSSAARNAIEVDQINFTALHDSLTLPSLHQEPQQTNLIANAGSENFVLSHFNIENEQSIVFDLLETKLSGHYSDTNQYNKLQIFYHTEAVFSDAQLVAKVDGRLALNELYNLELKMLLSAHTKHYFWISVDIAGFAQQNDSLQLREIEVHWLHSQTSSLLQPSAVYSIQAAIPELIIGKTNVVPTAASLQLGKADQLLTQFSISSSNYDAKISQLTIEIDSSWNKAAISELKIWYGQQANNSPTNDSLLGNAIQLHGHTHTFQLNDFEVPYGKNHIFSITASLACSGDSGLVYHVFPTDSNHLVTNGLIKGSTADTLQKNLLSYQPQQVLDFETKAVNKQLICQWRLPEVCYDAIVLLISTDSILTVIPQGDGSSYQANAVYGQGTALGNAFVGYKGKGSAAPLVGLNEDSTYYIAVYTLFESLWSTPQRHTFRPTSTAIIDFDSSTNWIQGELAFGSYSNHSYQSGDVIVQATHAIRNTSSMQDGFPGALGNYSFRLQDNASQLKIIVAKGGVSEFQIAMRRWDASPAPQYQLKYSLDKGSTYQVLSVINNDSLNNLSDWKTFRYPINSSNDSIWIEIERLGGERVMVDEFSYQAFEKHFTYWDGNLWSNGLPDSTSNAWILSDLTQSTAIDFYDLLVAENTVFSLDSMTNASIYNQVQLTGNIQFEHATLNINQSPVGKGFLKGGKNACLRITGSDSTYTLNFDTSNSPESNYLKKLVIRADSSSIVTFTTPLIVQNLYVESPAKLQSNQMLTLKGDTINAAEIIGGTQNQLLDAIKYTLSVPHLSPQHNGFRFLSHCLSTAPKFNEVNGLPNGQGVLIRYLESLHQTQGGYQAINNRNTNWLSARSVGVWIDKASHLTFTGTLQLDNVDSVLLDFSGSSTGWNFLGNPFPNTLDWDEVVLNQSVANAVYTWNNDKLISGTGSWGTYINGIAVNGGSRYLAPGQGFALKVLHQNPLPMINFPVSARTHAAAHNTQNRAANSYLKISLNKWENGKKLETIIRFEANASDQFDQEWDGVYLSDGDIRTPDIYSIDNNNLKYSINSIPQAAENQTIVPIGIEATGHDMLSLDFQFFALDNINSIEIEDLKTNQFRKLVNNAQFIFEGDTSFSPLRFRLHFNRQSKAKPLSNEQSFEEPIEGPLLLTHPGMLSIQLPEKWQQCTLFTSNGQKVWEVNAKNSFENTFAVALHTGVYIVRYQAENGQTNTKILIP